MKTSHFTVVSDIQEESIFRSANPKVVEVICSLENTILLTILWHCQFNS